MKLFAKFFLALTLVCANTAVSAQVDPVARGLAVKALNKANAAGTGTVSSVSVTTANGVSGIVTNPTTTPAISVTLGGITPSSVAASGTVTGSNLSGTNTGDQTTVSGQAGSVANAVTFDNSGSGAASGTTFNGSATRTVSTNTIGALKASNNLSDVTAATARTNLGLGTAATQSTGAFLQSANNLSDLASAPTAALNLQSGYVVCQSAAAVSTPNDTSEDTTDTCTIPANVMGANGWLRIDTLFTTTSSGNSKTLKVKFGATAYTSVAVTTSASEHFLTTISNRNSASSQVGPTSGLSTGFGVNSSSVTTSAIDTTASSSLTITCTKATGAETCTREAYQVVLFPKS